MQRNHKVCYIGRGRLFASVCIFMIGLCCFCLEGHAQTSLEGNYKAIFNGNDLDNWTQQWPGLWSVEDNQIIGKQDPEDNGDSWLFTQDVWDDFSLTLEFKITPGGNSGVGLRMPPDVEGRPSQYGFEIQINKQDQDYPTGSIYKHAAVEENLHLDGEWNRFDITVHQDHFLVFLNRHKVIDAIAMNSTSGRIGLQVHGGDAFADQVVQFKNLYVKDLKPQKNFSPSPVPFTIQQIDSIPCEAAAIGDINQDGYLDITCGPNWYPGPTFQPQPYRLIRWKGLVMDDLGEIMMDVNQDGFLDIVTGEWNSPILSWYENPQIFEGTQLWKQRFIATNQDQMDTILASDLDDDGDTDILVSSKNYAKPITYFEYVGMEQSETGFRERQIGSTGNGFGLGVGDINGDGYKDVITPFGWYENPAQNSDAPWTWRGNLPGGKIAGTPMLTDDINNDGLADILKGHAHNFGLVWYQQNFDPLLGQSWEESNIDTAFSQSSTLVLADLDGDNQDDLITGKRFKASGGFDPGYQEPLGLYWYKIQRGETPTFEKYAISYDENIGIGLNLLVTDIDGDGDNDILAPSKTGLYLIRNDRDPDLAVFDWTLFDR